MWCIFNLFLFNSKKVKFIDLDKQQSQIRFEIDEAIKKVLDHKRFILGPGGV